MNQKKKVEQQTKEPIPILFEVILLIMASILAVISQLQFIFGLEISLWSWFGVSGLSAIVTCRVIAKWARRNRDKIKGHIFELFFFILLFTATYCLSFILAGYNIEMMGFIFLFVIVGAAYCGWLHYREGIFTENYYKPKEKKKK